MFPLRNLFKDSGIKTGLLFHHQDVKVTVRGSGATKLATSATPAPAKEGGEGRPGAASSTSLPLSVSHYQLLSYRITYLRDASFNYE